MQTPYLSEDGSYILREPVALPEVLDVLIVGGGPAGTAAAFRAKELGLQVLVIDQDDLMRRIRDYAKDKLILPHFGGGSKMRFPLAGDLVQKLHFSPIDKDDMCALWRSFYCEFNVPAKVGRELTNLTQEGDVWVAEVWSRKQQANETYKARHVVLAIGRGMPRRFDIPGNTDGIPYRMDAPENFCEGPVCVIGGGTSAAEAVIAISNAKAATGDPAAVYWSYRGSKMPAVSQALSTVFFDAYVGNGNIRYFPNSDPVAVLTGPDRREYLALRVDRKVMEDRPAETAHLEFPKERCIACIGEDIDSRLLQRLGIDMVVGGSRNKKMMAVTPLLETKQPNLYVIGDLLSQAYLETTDFSTDPSGWRTVKHRGNIKSGLRDGVFIIEVIQQKLAGADEIRVELQDAPEGPAAEADLVVDDSTPATEDAQSIAPDRAVEEDGAILVLLSETDLDVQEYALKPDGATTIGRDACDISFPDDTRMAPTHVSLVARPEGYLLRVDNSRAETYLRLSSERTQTLRDRDILRLGRQILQIRKQENGDYVVLHYSAEGKLMQRYILTDQVLVMGREGGRHDPDLILSDDDLALSRFHVALSLQDGVPIAEDYNSKNGTYLKVADSVPLEDGDIFRVGRQSFQLALREVASKESVTIMPSRVDVPAVLPAPQAEVTGDGAPPAEDAEAVVSTAPSVTFRNEGKTLPIGAGECILDVADDNDIEIDYECWAGKCGLDRIRVLEGSEHLNPVSEKEAKTLKRRNMEPGPCRLACMVKEVNGPVVVEVVDFS